MIIVTPNQKVFSRRDSFMNSEIKLPDNVKPLSGWVCMSVGVGFIVALTILVVGVRLLGGQ